MISLAAVAPRMVARPAAACPLEQRNSKLVLWMPDSAAEIGLLEGEQIGRLAETAAAFRCFDIA